MASIILNGDLHAPTPVTHRLYTQPVTVPNNGAERFPPDGLAVHAMYEAMQRMLVGIEGPGDTIMVPASAPKVRIVNVSLGDERRRFAGIVSPWARLLDYFAYKHRVLFLVSAGNIPDELKIRDVQSFTELEDMAPERRTEIMLAAVFGAKSHRALLSPSEAINVMTVGAKHADQLGSKGTGAHAVDPFHVAELPNVSSALGTGANRCPKPEILMNGGRESVQMRSSRDPVIVVPVDKPGPFFGIGAATPGIKGELNRIRNVSGTSPAAALATNAALRIGEALHTTSKIDIPDNMLAVVLKAMLAHSATWNGDVSTIIEQLAEGAGYDHWIHKRIEVSRFLGLGSPTILRVLGNTSQRALVLGFGELERGKAAPFDFPLPQALNAKKEWRGMTATLAWLTPVHFRHRAYRHAALDLQLEGMENGSPIGVAKLSEQPDDGFGGRGTVIHRRWSGLDPAVFIKDQGIRLNVVCRSPTDSLDLPIPYALAVTLEVGEKSTIDIYTEVNTRVRAKEKIIIRSAASEK